MSDFHQIYDNGSVKPLRLLKATLRNVETAAGIVRRGGLIVYPTDTVYGLGCDPFNLKAIKRLLQVKDPMQKRKEKPLPILSNSLSNIERVAQISSAARILAERFWPGPLTLILPKKNLPKIGTSGQEDIGVRIPNNETSLMLLRASGGLLIGTSANKTGCPPPINMNEAIEQLGDQVDLFLDGGTTQVKVSSTVVDMTHREPRILRQGAINLNQILRSLRSHNSN